MVREKSMKQIHVYVPEDDIAKLKELVKLKLYPHMSEAVRLAIHDLVRSEYGI